RGRPPVGDGPGVVVPVRLDAATLAALAARAEAEGISTRSDAIRAAVREWIDVA
ncbi:MAG: ribbon-helix-helix protein, CopG family, partial [Propionicimonas sp.]|uniref:ribbon-helix-helix protein, CopG family n=1 Tax=Propionicimonas sp. TaxID=1955623 RepID=UPI002B2090B0